MSGADQPQDRHLPSVAELEETFRPIAEKVLRQAIDGWSTAFRETIRPVQSSSKALASKLEAEEMAEATLPALWSTLEGTFEEYLAWAQGLDIEASDWFAAPALGAWEAEFRRILEDLPATVKIAIADPFWETGPEDTVSVQAWKWAKRRQRAVKRTLRGIRNRGRKIVRKPPLALSPEVRALNLRALLETELALPMGRFLLGEWQRSLQQAARELFRLHDGMEAVENESLFPGEKGASAVRPDPASASLRQGKVIEKAKDLIAGTERTEALRVASIERFSQSWGAIAESLRKKWEAAGTFALPNRKFGPARIVKARKRLEADLERARQAWQQHFCGEIQEWQKDLELCRLQLLTTRLYSQTTEAFSGRVEKDIVPPLEDTLALIRAHGERIQASRVSSKAELKKLIVTDNRSLSDKLRRERLPLVLDALVGAELDALLRSIPARIRAALEAVPERFAIFQERDLDDLEPGSKVDEVPVAAIVLDEIFPRLAKDIESLGAEAERASDGLFREAAEIDQIIDYNSESALALLEEKKGDDAVEESHRIAGEGLDRAHAQAAGLVDKVRALSALASESLAASSEGFIDRLQDLENSEKVMQMKLRFARAQAKRKVRGYGLRAWAGLKAGFAGAFALTMKVFGRARAAYGRLRKLSGLVPQEVGLEDKLAAFLHHTQGRIASLPYVYQRLFRIEPLTDKRFYIGREAEKGQLKEALQGWQAGQYAATALVGEKGSGKTTILNFAAAEYFAGLPQRKLDLVNTTVRTKDELFKVLKGAFDRPHTESLDALEKDLASGEDKLVFVLENAQNLFLRTVDGFEAIERFLLFLSRTNASVLWIVTCTLYSWNYLDKVFRVSKYFKRVVTLGSLTREETADLILKRHRISGYPFQFEVPELPSQPRKLKKIAKPAEQQAFLQSWFFEQLNRLAAGNVAVAMWFWLGAIKSIVQGHFVVTPVIDLDYSFLRKMEADELFTLAALLQHETLTAEEHALIFRQALDDSLLLFNRLLNKRYLTFAEGRYAIHPLLYRPSVAALKVKNIVH